MGIKDELSSSDRELSLFPVRAFEFKNAGTIIITQDVADVGSVVWDAEVVLAHYIDLAHGFQLRGRRVLELGAGTGLAGIVAARLGATVLLTDQAKLVPTLLANARANAPELELSAPWPVQRRPCPRTGHQRQSGCIPSPGPAPDSGVPDTDACDPFGSRGFDASKRAFPGAGTVAPRGGPSPRPDGGPIRGRGTPSGGCVQRAEADEIGEPPKQGPSSGAGGWRVAELLISEDEAGLRAAFGLGEEDEEDEEKEEGGIRLPLFDLVIAADVVYLVKLWDAMAFTIKSLVRSGGRALMSFEQRRSNVDNFFGPPRFGHAGAAGLAATSSGGGGGGSDLNSTGSDEWEPGEEVRIGESSAGAALGEAASAANVRLFRIVRHGRQGNGDVGT